MGRALLAGALALWAAAAGGDEPAKPEAAPTGPAAPAAAPAGPATSDIGAAPAADVSRGAALYVSQVCVACHSIDGTPRVGPTLRGIFGRTETLADGSSALVDEAYFRESLMRPGARMVKGFLPAMPPYEGRLSDEDVAALAAYLRSVR